MRADADAVLPGAAAAGADLADLGALAEEMRRRAARPDAEGAGFAERWARLDQTLEGAGRLAGDLTPQCAAAVRAVPDALGKRAGPEDLRSKGQRAHDALEEACRRLIAAGCLPERAGQPTRIQLVMTLGQLLGLGRGNAPRPAVPGPAGTTDPGLPAGTAGTADSGPSAGMPGRTAGRDRPGGGHGPDGGAEAAADRSPAGRNGWLAHGGPRRGASGGFGWLAGGSAGGAGRWWPGSAPAGPGAECDATIIPIVTGHVDPGVLDQLAAGLVRPGGSCTTTTPHPPAPPEGRDHGGSLVSGQHRSTTIMTARVGHRASTPNARRSGIIAGRLASRPPCARCRGRRPAAPRGRARPAKPGRRRP